MSALVDRPLLRYFGGKWRLASWIISHFPEHTHYVEPFGGAASVLLKKEPARFEVYNDLDSDVVNFFRILRERPRELLRVIRHTPYSREEFERSYHVSADPLERARQFFVMAWQGYGGPRRKMLTGWKYQSRAWESGRADQVAEWNKAKSVFGAARRMATVQVEHDDALNVIRRFDCPTALFYCDPPYPSNTRNQKWSKTAYTLELQAEDHLHLANLLNRIKGMAIVSTYPNPLYDELYPGWRRVTKTVQTMHKTIATEVLYLSPNIPWGNTCNS